MKNKFLVYGMLILVFFVLYSKPSQAMIPLMATSSSNPEAVIIATVNVYDAEIVSQNGNDIKISFDINNREGAQAGIKYAISLVEKISDNERKLIDQKVYDEIISLSENSTITKEINYEAPAYLSGIYDVLITSQTEKGLPLGSNFAGSVNLAGDGEYIGASGCSFFVQGGNDAKKYSIEQGGSVNGGEGLEIDCLVKNNFKTSQKITPKLNIYYRNIYGEKISDNENIEGIDLKAGEAKNFSYVISTESMKPQSYDGTLVFVDDNGKVISNKNFFYYIVRGNNATIQNVKLDKDYYADGDIAKVSFFITSFNDSDGITMELSLNSKNQTCSDAVREELSGGGQGDLSVPIKKDCVNPEIVVSVKDREGNLLDQVNQKIVSKQSLSAQGVNLDDKNVVRTGASLVALVVILIILIIILVISLKKGKNKNPIKSIAIFVLVGFGMFFGGTNVAKGDTIKVGTYWPGGITLCQTSGTCVPTFVYTVNTDKATYNVGQSVSVEASLNVYPSGNQNAVYNHPPTGCYLRASGLSGGSVCAINVYNFNAINAHFKYYTDVSNLGTSSEFGNKTITFSATGYSYNGSLQEWNSNSPLTVYYNKTINFVGSSSSANNSTITDPVITGPTSGLVNTDYNFDIVSSGVNNINYYIDWDDDGIADQETVQINGNSYIFSQPGVPKTVTHKWNSLGTKTFAVRAAGPLRKGNINTAMSATASYYSNVVRYTIVIGNEPAVPPVLIQSDGVCGAANSQVFCKTPSRDNLCDSNSALSNFNFDGVKWSWDCKGKNNGATANCSASKDCSWREVNP